MNEPTPTLSLVPAQPPVPPEALKGIALEDAARATLKRTLGLTATVSAPTWRELVFAGKPIPFKVPEVPGGVAARIGALRPDTFPKDAVGLAALQLAEKLQKAKPGGTFKRSVAPGKPFPVAHGARADWERFVFLVAAGPEVVPLLAAAGYLTASDVDTLTEFYPEGLEAQRLAAVGAATSLTHAAARTGHDPNLSDWLNDQMLTLMAEERPTDVFQAMYEAKDPQQQQSNQGPSASGARSRIADNYRPDPGIGDAS